MNRVRSRNGTIVSGALAALALALTARGQVTVEATLEPGVLAVGERGALTVEVRGARRPSPPEMPAMAGGVQIRFAGGEQRITIVNFQRDSAMVYRYDLLAVREGEYRLGPFRYTVDGQTLEIPALDVKILPAKAARDEVRSLSDALIAELRADRDRPYAGESFEVTLTLLFRSVNVDRDLNLTGLPESGLQFQRWEELPAGREARNGRVYEARRFRARVRALTPGEYRLAPSLRLNLLIERRERRRSPMDDFFPGFPDLSALGRVERQPVDLPVSPVELTVRPLPEEGRPASFSGAVGRFTFDAEIAPAEIPVGEPLTLRMIIEGDGNLEAVSAPGLAIGENFRAYDAQLTNRESDPAGRRGRRVYERILIPRDETATEVPAVEFSFFDPRAEAYRTLSRGPFPLKLLPAGAAPNRLVIAPPTDGGGIRVEGTDLVYLKSAPRRWRRAEDWNAFSHPFWRGYPWLVAIAALAAALADRRRARRADDPALARRERAPRAAREGLRRAEAAAKIHDRKAFYDAVWKSLTDYFGNRLNLPPGEVGPEQILERGAAAPPAEWTAELKALFAECETARYAAVEAAAPDFAATIARLRGVLRAAEKMRWRAD